ncbi:Dna-directed rna polymerase v subunit, partial [Thalictrum thalictroides]
STASISGCPINHPTQLTNPFLGLPLESGKCESCGTAEPGQCDGHFGYIELPIPIYHPCHVTELKRLLSLVCLNCLRLKKAKNVGSDRLSNAPCLYCPDIPQLLVNEVKTDGVVFLELKLPPRSIPKNCFWNFLDRYGYRYGDSRTRTLLPCEVLEILKGFSEDTRKKLANKNFFTQDGYILQILPVPPNCLSIPEISDGVTVMSSDISVSMLRKVLKQVDIIKSSRSGRPNFESHKVEVNDLQSIVAQYLRARGAAKDSRDIQMRVGVSKEADDSATKAWLEKMRTFFISKGSGHSSRSVITGDAYKNVDEIGLPLEVAQRITFEEKVTEHNQVHLQGLVDKKLCLTYRDGVSIYSLREGSKGHTLLRVGQVVHRRIMDGDIVFINRPPSTHKHSLQALSVYVHEDHTVKINPLICGPLDADFDGDCVHLFYPQSLAARAEVLELFAVEQQLLSSHTGILNLQLKNDSLLSLKTMFKRFFLGKVTSQQLAMFIPTSLPEPALVKANSVGSQWTVLQILQTALPNHFDSVGERYFISQSELLKFDFNRDTLQSMFNEIISSVFFEVGSKEALNVFNSLQPLLMENLFSDGYSVCLKDFSIPKSLLEDIPRNVQDVSPLLHHLRSTYNELVESQVGSNLKTAKASVVDFILKVSGLGNLIDSKSESSINKVVEQIGFLGLQLADRRKFYSRNLVEDMTSLFLCKYAVHGVGYPSEAFGLIKSCFFHGLNPYEDLVHSISSREVLVRSSRGLTEPGTLFKNLMTILRDVVICYDGTVRNVCSNSIIQFEYGVEAGMDLQGLYPAGEPVGALAATAISNPSYKAVLDSSSSSNTSWELMKEVLVCKVNFKNDLNDRRVILYLNNCSCVKKHCKENAAYLVQNQLKKVSLRDISVNFLIEYQNQQSSLDSPGTNTSLVGHIHLEKKRLKELEQSMHEILLKCQETISLVRRRKKSKLGDFLKNIFLSVSECCCSHQSHDSEWGEVPCLQFSWRLDMNGVSFDILSQIMANEISPILLDTIIKGDRRVSIVNIIWISPETTTWVNNNYKIQHGELALELVLEKKFVKKHGDAWRLALDSCLPVIHLIDTIRSIPYAIRQVQELLGISCAFDQAVQRLSTSIRMVNKGVLKEHLILAANSMTCTGSLIGFNKGGYKALFRSLNVQIPFTEATLFTPRKCFERAAEKCHTDTLAGIVASCSWGKHAAVGSGTRFEILWNKKEMGVDYSGVKDIYSFLLLVSSNRGESDTLCLGGEYDDLEIENRVAEMRLSPDQNYDYSKLTFDDAELQCNFEQHQTEDKEISSESNWEKAVSGVDSGRCSEWEVDQHGDVENAVAWSNPSDCADLVATVDKFQTQVRLSKKPSEGGSEAGWNTLESQKMSSNEHVDAWGKQAKESDTNGWDKNVNSQLGQWCVSHECHSAKASEKSPHSADWNIVEIEKQPPQTGAHDGWENRAESQWDQSEKSNVSHSEKSLAESPRSGNWDVVGSQEISQMEPCDTWGQKAEKAKSSSWSRCDQVPQPTGLFGWNSPCAVGWTKNGQTQDEQERDLLCDSWGKTNEETKSSGGWSQTEDTNRPTSSIGWSSPNATDWASNEKLRNVERDLCCDTSGKNVEKKNSDGWSQHEEVNQQTGSLGWSSPSDANWTSNGHTKDEQERNLSWGMMREQGKKPSGSRGWGSSNSGDWKLKNNRFGQSAGRLDNRNAWGNFTASRQKLDQFTPEEQKILLDVEPIMLSLKKILNSRRYNDGDPLSPDDQSYVLDNVFNYHPEKAVKMGLGVDYVMISKHSSFQDTRCFYIVSTDGHREDFSYRKCLENFIKDKYPELAASFVEKYWPHSRGQRVQEQATSWQN